MDPSIITSIIIAVVTLIGWPLALRSRKKGGPKKVEELYQHLLTMGVKSYQSEDAIRAGKTTEKAVGTIVLLDRNIDALSVIGVATQFTVQYYLDFQVKTPGTTAKRTTEKIKMVRKKRSSFQGKMAGIEWKGECPLAQRLNMDYQLKDCLAQAKFQGNIEIIIEPKYEYARIRTAYFLPALDFIQAIDTIARHIRSD